MTCYQLAAGSEGASILSVTAGSAVTFTVSPDIYHPGPLSVWLGRVPSGQTAQTWDGSGANWFKIYQDYPTVTSSGLTWANNGTHGRFISGLSFRATGCLISTLFIYEPSTGTKLSH